MAKKCEPGECENDPTYTTPIVVPELEGDGGGHKLVAELPETGTSGMVYILVDNEDEPTKAYGMYTYKDGWVLTAQPVDQSVVKVDELPEEGKEGILYYLPNSEDDAFDLYRWINSEWVKVDTDVKLYSSTGTNTDGAMTQKAVSNLIYPDGSESSKSKVAIQIGTSSSSEISAAGGAIVIGSSDGTGNRKTEAGNWCIAIGRMARAITSMSGAGGTSIAIGADVGANTVGGHSAIAIGQTTAATADKSIAIGHNVASDGQDSIAIGASSHAYNGLGGVAIGYSSIANGQHSTAIGPVARADSVNSTAIGYAAHATNGSIALGAGAESSVLGTVVVSGPNNFFGYKNTVYRVIRGVHDGEEDHDAVTVGQLKAAVGNVESLLEDINSGTGV